MMVKCKYGYSGGRQAIVNDIAKRLKAKSVWLHRIYSSDKGEKDTWLVTATLKGKKRNVVCFGDTLIELYERLFPKGYK